MKLISMKLSCLVLFIIVMSSIADDSKWSEKPKIARRIKRINQKLANFNQVLISSRKSFKTEMNNNCEKMSWGSELSMFKEVVCNQIEKTAYLYFITLVGIVLIILIFYFHIMYPEYYLSESKDHQLWHNTRFNEDIYKV